MQDGTQELTHRDFDKSICAVEIVYRKNDPHLCVATTSDIHLFKFKSNQQLIYNFTQLEDSGYPPLALQVDERVSNIVQSKKTGRIFYSSHFSNFRDCLIKELNIDVQANSIQTFLGFADNQNKRLKSEEPQFETTTSKIIRSIGIFNVFKRSKVIKQIKIDDKRNVLYALCYQVTDGREGSA
jgi:hypothetical protein